MQVVALMSIEGKAPTIAPGSVFEVEESKAKRLLDMGSVREASKEDVALARVKGLLIEPEAKSTEDKTDTESSKDKVEVKSTAAPKQTAPKQTETKSTAKADDVL